MNAMQSFTVVAAVIRDECGRILLARRPEGRHMAGLWEFPGGKIKPGETPEAALRREIDEELGLDIDAVKPVTFAVHEEDGVRILLLFFSAAIRKGVPMAREGQEIAWVPASELTSYDTPPADAAIIERLARGDVG